MPVRDTSIEAYKRIQREGLLAASLWELYHIFFTHGPLTGLQANEIWCHQNEKRSNLNQFRAKITMLKQRGVLKELPDTVVCENTNMRVHQYDVTRALPTEPKKRTKKDLKRETLERLVHLGGRIPEQYKPELREIYHLVNKL